MDRAVKLLHHAVAVRKAEIRKAGIPACRIRRGVKRSVGRGIEIIVDVQPVNVVIRDYFGGSCRDKLRHLVVCRVQVVGTVDVHCVLPRHSVALCKGVDRKASVAGNIRAAARTQRIYPGVERYPALVSLGDHDLQRIVAGILAKRSGDVLRPRKQLRPVISVAVRANMNVHRVYPKIGAVLIDRRDITAKALF